MKRCGLYIRVSTDKQAKVEEGSLKAQNELLTHHIELKNKLGGEEWVVVDRYVDEGRSAKDTQGRPQYLRLMDDVRRGRINTVMCMALSRISRSTRDLLDMIEFLKQRGLWHAGPILGYDRPPEKKGHLVPNPKEAAVVNAAFDTYLECGSILKTCGLLTANGYRTKEYVTHEGRLHRARPFVYTSVQNLLTNLAYIGKREINKQWMHHPPEQLPESQRYKTVDGVWEPIVPVEKFNQVQALLRQNHEHNRNEVRPSRHVYLLNGGLLFCNACGSQMEGTAGTGKLGKIYYYYHCTSRRCGFRLPEGEVEQAMQVVSGAVGRERVHYAAPPGQRVEKDMKQFLSWWRASAKREDGLLRAGLAHVYVVTIHPFEDGNGRIARALTDMALAQDEHLPTRHYSLSSQVMEERHAYYRALEACQKGDGDVTPWLQWYLGCYTRAVECAERLLADVLAKATFWQRHSQVDLNARQRKVINRLVDAGKGGVQGGLTTRKYVAMAKVS